MVEELEEVEEAASFSCFAWPVTVDLAFPHPFPLLLGGDVVLRRAGSWFWRSRRHRGVNCLHFEGHFLGMEWEMTGFQASMLSWQLLIDCWLCWVTRQCHFVRFLDLNWLGLLMLWYRLLKTMTFGWIFVRRWLRTLTLINRFKSHQWHHFHFVRATWYIWVSINHPFPLWDSSIASSLWVPSTLKPINSWESVWFRLNCGSYAIGYFHLW